MTKTAEMEKDAGTERRGLKARYEEIGRCLVEIMLAGVENPLQGLYEVSEPDPEDREGFVHLLAAWLRARERRIDPKEPVS